MEVSTRRSCFTRILLSDVDQITETDAWSEAKVEGYVFNESDLQTVQVWFGAKNPNLKEKQHMWDPGSRILVWNLKFSVSLWEGEENIYMQFLQFLLF